MYKIEQSHIVISIAVKMLAGKRADEIKSTPHRPYQHTF